MRRTAATLLATCLLAALTACGDSNDDKPASKPTAEASPTVSPGDKFLDDVHQAAFDSWLEAAPTDDELLDYPMHWCNELEKGHSVQYVFDVNEGELYPVGMDWGTEKTDANELLLLAVKAYCPELRKQVIEDLRDAGEY